MSKFKENLKYFLHLFVVLCLAASYNLSGIFTGYFNGNGSGITTLSASPIETALSGGTINNLSVIGTIQFGEPLALTNDVNNPPTAIAGYTYLWNSNSIIYLVTTTSTNRIEVTSP